MSVNELPIGRRVAQWRTRRRMTQQMLADRLGKSKSWVDKVERGARTLDRFSVIQEVAEVLRVDPAALLGNSNTRPSASVAASAEGDAIDAVRAALARYDFTSRDRARQSTEPVAEVDQQVQYAWLTYQHAHYSRLLRLLPGLLDAAQRAHAVEPERGADLLVQAYQISASVLVKIGAADLAWLAADRAVAVAAGDPLRTAVAAISLAQALRALGQDRLAMAAALTAAHRLSPATTNEPQPGELSALGALLLQAASAAAGCGDARSVHQLTGQAVRVAELVGDGHDHHWTSFGRTTVEMTRVVTAVELGAAAEAILRHEKVTRREQWSRLPAEYRAAYLVDVARAYLQIGEVTTAGRLLVEADRTAPAETRSRPTARTLIAAVARSGPATAGITRLASILGVS